MKYFYLLSLFLILTSCNFNTTYSNQESDKKEAEKITNKLYWEIQYGTNEDEIFKLFSDQFFAVTNKNELREIISKSNSKFGAIKEPTLAEWETLVVKGTNARSEYVFIYDVARENTKTKEKISMIKENGNIKVVGYHVNQDLLNQ